MPDALSVLVAPWRFTVPVSLSHSRPLSFQCGGGCFCGGTDTENVHEHKNRAFSGDTGSYRGQMFGGALSARFIRTPLLYVFPPLLPTTATLFAVGSFLGPSFNCRYTGKAVIKKVAECDFAQRNLFRWDWIAAGMERLLGMGCQYTY